MIINFSLADLIGVGSAVPISVSLGKKTEHADNIFTCACIMIVGAGDIAGSCSVCFCSSSSEAAGSGGRLLDLAVQYLRVYAVCAPVSTIIFAVDNYLRICGKIKGSMYLNVFMSVLTAVLEFVFLYIFKMGNLGEPDWQPVQECFFVLQELSGRFPGKNGLHSVSRDFEWIW